jgi:Lon protease-like protein
MALLRPGWEKDYYGRPAIEGVVCVGSILSHEQLSDGCYNFLLRGHTRAKIVRELTTETYRQAELEPLVDTDTDESALADARRQLVALFDRPSYATLPGGTQIRHLLAGGIPTSAIADLLAFNVLDDEHVALKQELLAETSVRTRVARILDALTIIQPAWRNVPDNASMN